MNATITCAPTPGDTTDLLAVEIFARTHPDGVNSMELAEEFDRIADTDTREADHRRVEIIDTLRHGYGYDFGDYMDAREVAPGLTMKVWILQVIAKDI